MIKYENEIEIENKNENEYENEDENKKEDVIAQKWKKWRMRCK